MIRFPGISVPGTPGSSNSSLTRSSDDDSSWAEWVGDGGCVVVF